MSARSQHCTTQNQTRNHQNRRHLARPAVRLGVSTLALLAAGSLTLASAASADPTADRASLAAGPAAVVAAKAEATARASAHAATITADRAAAADRGAADRAAAAERANRAASSRQALAARQARFAHFTLKSADTKDMRGVEPSLYRGKFFNATAEEKRLCIVKRESEGEYDVVNPSGSYFGAYQVSRPLARGVTFMMLPEHKKLMGTAKAKEVLSTLRTKPMNTWPRYWQDAAFHTIINWEGTLSGASHWAGGRWHC